jgi:hypothetical protein
LFDLIVAGDDPNCIVDDTLPASASGNYVDCTTKEMEAEGRTICCKIEGSVGCCEPNGRLAIRRKKKTNSTYFRKKNTFDFNSYIYQFCLSKV